jgi:hypothetical protein
LATTGIDDAVAHPSQARVDTENPQVVLSREGKFEISAIASLAAFKHLAEHLHNSIARVHLFQRIFAETVAETTGGNTCHIVFAHVCSPLKSSQGASGTVGHDVSPQAIHIQLSADG